MTRGQVVWAAKRRRADAPAGRFEHPGETGCAAIESVTLDMAGGYNKKTVREHLPYARIVFDRLHVQWLAGDVVDLVRRGDGAGDQTRSLCVAQKIRGT